MAVVAMIVMMIMVVAITMVMVVVTMIVMVVTVMMVVMTMLLRSFVGAAFGLERRINNGHLGAQALEQRFYRRIAGEPQPPLQDLHRYMTVTEMPGQARKRGKVGRANLEQQLGLSDDLDQFAVVEHQCVVGAQPRSLRKIDLDAGAFDPEHEALFHLPLRVRQDQSVDDSPALALGSRLDAGGARHGVIRGRHRSVEAGRPLGLLRRLRGHSLVDIDRPDALRSSRSGIPA